MPVEPEPVFENTGSSLDYRVWSERIQHWGRRGWARVAELESTQIDESKPI